MNVNVVDRVTPITLPAETKNSELQDIYGNLPSADELRTKGTVVETVSPESLGLNPRYYQQIETVLFNGNDYHIFSEYRDEAGNPCSI